MPRIAAFAAALAVLAWSGAAAASTAGEEERGMLARIAEVLTEAIEAAGIAIILIGAVLATWRYLRDGRRCGWASAYEAYRADLGRAILLGLEMLVAADIIGTVAAPLDVQTVGALALIVVIRTFLSFSLEVEIKGRWPWHEAAAGRDAEAEAKRTGG
ncbi:MAG TPA: DUF1622 domain-containing protein [Alphaproteobacteria bacterium]|nr:DUF1622 domain-containing protein [Alphaproteobacteria bacterium]